MDKKQVILSNARQLFLEQGYQSTSIQSIAKVSDVSKGSVYSYFESKEDILFTLFRQLDDEIWEKLSLIRHDDSLTAKEKYHQQIITFYDQILENLQFNQAVINDSGLELSERLMDLAKESRYKLQTAQELSLLQLYGDKINPWLTDLIFTLNGIMYEIDVSIMFNEAELNSEDVANYMCHVTDSLVNGFYSEKPAPLFPEYVREKRLSFLKESEQKQMNITFELYDQLNTQASKLTLSNDDKNTLDETLELLNESLETVPVNKTLVKALLTSLGDFDDLQDFRSQLANHLDIRIR